MTISLVRYSYDGSKGERIIFTFSHNLSDKQKRTFERLLRARECASDIHSIHWQKNNRVRVEVRRKTIGDGSRIDIRRGVSIVLKRIQLNPQQVAATT